MPVALAPPAAAPPREDEDRPAASESAAERRGLFSKLVAAVRAVVGLLSFGGLLAAVAALPGGPLLALGWMLEAEGRAATDGRTPSVGETSAAEPPRPLGRLLRASAVVAALAAVTWAALLPVGLMAGLSADAAIINPSSPAATGWRVGAVATAALIVLHLSLWAAAGGRTGWFRPLRNLIRVLSAPGAAADRLGAKCVWLWTELAPLRAAWLGLRGLLVAAAWLLGPSALLAIQGDGGGRAVLRILGALTLTALLPLVPAAQANLAAAKDDGPWRSLRAGLSPRAAWRTWRARPARWTGVLVAAAVGSLPLYSLAVVELPADARWLLTPACIAAILPSRLLAGWTRRGTDHARRPRWWWAFPWLSFGWALAAAYAGLLFLTQFTSADGPAATLRQPGFYVPVPFQS